MVVVSPQVVHAGGGPVHRELHRVGGSVHRRRSSVHGRRRPIHSTVPRTTAGGRSVHRWGRRDSARVTTREGGRGCVVRSAATTTRGSSTRPSPTRGRRSR